MLLCRNRILQDIDRFIHPEQVINRVVYSLDDTVLSQGSSYTTEHSQLSNFDEQKFVYFCYIAVVQVTAETNITLV